MQTPIQSISLSADGAVLQTTFKDDAGITVVRDVAALCKFCGNQSDGFKTMGGIFPKPDKWAIIVGGTKKEPLRFYICTQCCKHIAQAK